MFIEYQQYARHYTPESQQDRVPGARASMLVGIGERKRERKDDGYDPRKVEPHADCCLLRKSKIC